MRHNQRIPPPVPRTFVPPSPGEVIEHRGIYIGERIAGGSFSTVYNCRDQRGTELAAKVLSPRNLPYEKIRLEWIDECQKLQLLRHPHVISIYQAFEYRDTFYLIFEKCLCTLEDLIRNPNINGELWLPYVSRDILNGLQHIHDHGYVHKDLHPGNIFVSEQRDPMDPNNPPIWRFKIGDLGISRREVDIRFNTILAKWMLPPERLSPQDFGALGRHTDIYHVGLLLLCLLLNQTPHFTPSNIIAGHPRKLAERLSSRYAAAIARALRRHVNYRTPSAIDMWREILLAHRFNCSQN